MWFPLVVFELNEAKRFMERRPNENKHIVLSAFEEYGNGQKLSLFQRIFGQN
jgi:hypothetical protein